MANKYRAIVGQLPKHFELADWPEQKFLDYFDIVNFLTEGDKIKVTNEKIEELERRGLDGTPTFLTELLWRIGHFRSDPDFTNRKWYFKFLSCNMQIGNYLKKHPALVTQAIREKIEINPRVTWMLEHYKVAPTNIGAEIIVPSTINDTNPLKREFSPKPKDPRVLMMESALKLADAASILTQSLTRSELRAMETKEKFKSLRDIFTILNSFKEQPTTTIFQTIKTHQAGRDELEAAILDFAKE
jgi:hypothetical protein